MRPEPATKLALFFSYGLSLEASEKVGFFDRKVGYYQRLRRELGEILFITYDRPSEALTRLLVKLAPITAVYNRWGLSSKLFSLLAPLIHAGALNRCRALKTLQISGAWTAVIAKWLLRKPLVVRCGVVWSWSMRLRKVNWPLLYLTLLLERLAVKAANLVFVAKLEDATYLVQTHRIPSEKIKVVPNPIDTELFQPSAESQKEQGLVIFVGRRSSEKNLDLALQACRRVEGTRLWVIGALPSSPEEELLVKIGKVKFLGNIPNNELPYWLNQAQVFVLPSKYEGSPKTLLEAMACGLAVIGTNVPGIREVIDHEVNGLLCEPNLDSLTAALTRLLDDGPLRGKLGSQAREYGVQNHSMKRVVQREAAIWRSLLEKET